jgi:uncharacterized protein with HEPN domain
MTQREDHAYVLDVREAGAAIEAFVRGASRDAFLASDEKQSAVLLKIIVMGEATKRLSREFRTRHAQIPWADIAGMRDRLVHGYDQWDLEEVWKVATIDITKLLRDLDRLLGTLDLRAE